jgi:hypothetical protein
LSAATRLDISISDLPANLGVIARRFSCGFEQNKEIIAASVAKVARPFL